MGFFVYNPKGSKWLYRSGLTLTLSCAHGARACSLMYVRVKSHLSQSSLYKNIHVPLILTFKLSCCCC